MVCRHWRHDGNSGGMATCRRKACHSEPVTDVTGVGIRTLPLSKRTRIATPVCGLARNDSTKSPLRPPCGASGTPALRMETKKSLRYRAGRCGHRPLRKHHRKASVGRHDHMPPHDRRTTSFSVPFSGSGAGAETILLTERNHKILRERVGSSCNSVCSIARREVKEPEVPSGVFAYFCHC